MSFSMHLRAVSPEVFRPDSTWIAAFMLASWTNHQEEYAAGIADSIEKDFEGVNRLYSGTLGGLDDAAHPSGLPVFGGDLVPRDDGPPFLVLRPQQVSDAAAFLNAISFDTLWAASGDAICESWGDPSLARPIYLNYHEGLVAFFQRAAQTGQFVLKAFWY